MQCQNCFPSEMHSSAVWTRERSEDVFQCTFSTLGFESGLDHWMNACMPSQTIRALVVGNFTQQLVYFKTCVAPAGTVHTRAKLVALLWPGSWEEQYRDVYNWMLFLLQSVTKRYSNHCSSAMLFRAAHLPAQIADSVFIINWCHNDNFINILVSS